MRSDDTILPLTCEDIDVAMVTDMSANNIRASLKSFKLSLTFFLTQKMIGFSWEATMLFFAFRWNGYNYDDINLNNSD